VLSLNERTDERGEIRTPVVTSPESTSTTQYAATTAAVYSVDMVTVHLLDDKEPWSKGDAEIAMKAKSRGCSGVEYTTTNWSGLNNSGDWWGHLGGDYRNMGLTTCDVVFYWWEDDGGSADFSLEFGGFSLGVQMDDGDDLIGGKQVPYSSFKGGDGNFYDSVRHDDWDALIQYTE